MLETTLKNNQVAARAFTALCLGAVLVVAALGIGFLPTASTSQDALQWEPAPNTDSDDSVSASANGLHVTLDSKGTQKATLRLPPFKAKDFAYLNLTFAESENGAKEGKPTRITLCWKSSTAPEEQQAYRLEAQSRANLWLATAELPRWRGVISDLELEISGKPNATVWVKEFSLHSASITHQLRSIFSDLVMFPGWNRASMNAHIGAVNSASFYPAILFAGWFASSLFVYALMCLPRPIVNANWYSVGLIFLAVWISLDLVWQNRLLQQLGKTWHQFSGKTSEQKLVIGPDAELYQFIDQAKHAIHTTNPRIFVGSSDDYTGLRGAYYLYPKNVYWRLHGSELPPPFLLRSGDYIVLLHPSDIELNRESSELTFTRRSLSVDILVDSMTGLVLRVR